MERGPVAAGRPATEQISHSLTHRNRSTGFIVRSPIYMSQLKPSLSTREARAIPHVPNLPPPHQAFVSVIAWGTGPRPTLRRLSIARRSGHAVSPTQTLQCASSKEYLSRRTLGGGAKPSPTRLPPVGSSTIHGPHTTCACIMCLACRCEMQAADKLPAQLASLLRGSVSIGGWRSLRRQ